MNGRLLVTGGHLLDPARGLDTVGDVLIESGKIAAVGKVEGVPQGCTVVAAQGLVVCPGFIDLHSHLREPGFEDKETIATGTRAAARGGYATVCCMPNTSPPLDTRGAVDWVAQKAAAEGVVRVLPVACITRGRKGRELADMGELAAAGAVGFSDDGDSVPDSRLIKHALEYSQAFDLPVMEHCEDRSLSEGGMVNEGRVATRMGLRGIPPAAEEVVVARDLSLAAFTGARLHIQHLSTAGSVELVRHAKEKGARVTAEATPHHLVLTEDRVMGQKWGMLEAPGRSTPLHLDAYDTDAKVNPPLRTAADREALVAALKDGTIDAIATDHAPHAWVDKACEFGLAEFGASGLETALGALMVLVHRGEITLSTLVLKLTHGPAAALGPKHAQRTGLARGLPADIALFDPGAEWTVTEADLVSNGKNTPFKGCMLKGKVLATIVAGNIVYQDERLQVGEAQP